MRWIFLIAISAASLFAQLSAPNESGVSLGHIHLMVADPEVQKKLWVGVLGAEVTHAGTLELLKLPGIFLIVGKARTPPSEGTEGSMVNHFGFLVKSYAETKAKLTAAGLDFATDNAATRQLMVNFPDKVKVEFTEDASLKVPLAMHHIHMSTPDMEKLRGWYVKTFGARPGTRGNFLSALFNWRPRSISARRNRRRLLLRDVRSITSVSRSATWKSSARSSRRTASRSKWPTAKCRSSAD